MKNLPCWTLFSLALGLFLLGLVTSPVLAGDLADAGQIKLLGRVTSVNLPQHTFLLATAGYADENSKKWTVFSKARPKTVNVPGVACYTFAQGFDMGQVAFGRLRVGMPVIVTANAAGAAVGKAITAHLVGLFAQGNTFDLTAYQNLLAGNKISAPQSSPPTITTQPTDVSAPCQSQTVLSVAATGFAPLSYQWYQRDIAILEANAPTYVIDKVSASDADEYQVIVTDALGRKTVSDPAVLTVTGQDKDTSGSDPAGRLFVTAKASRMIRMPAWDKSWRIQYRYLVPPLPGANWDYDRHTFYIWGDINFDPYGQGAGSHRLSAYDVNQIVPQLEIGWILSGNDANYHPTWSKQKTWVIQSQYFWLKNLPESHNRVFYAQNGSQVDVKPGDEITTVIAYDAVTGKIAASISAPEGTSHILIDRPFPNEPNLFANWTEFFKKAQAVMGGNYFWAIPEFNIEPHELDKKTMCTILPFVMTGVEMPNIGNSGTDYAQRIQFGLPYPYPVVRFAF